MVTGEGRPCHSVTSISWVSLAEHIQFETLLLAAVFSILLVRSITPTTQHHTRMPHLLRPKVRYGFSCSLWSVYMFLFPSCSSAVMAPGRSGATPGPVPTVGCIARVSTQGVLMPSVNKLTDGNSVFLCWSESVWWLEQMNPLQTRSTRTPHTWGGLKFERTKGVRLLRQRC